jgi:hypothetical protein
MKKWLKYSILISILLPLFMTELTAQEYKLQKFVFGGGGMVGIVPPAGTTPSSGMKLSGQTGQTAIEKRDARSILHGQSFDMYQGFWTPTKLNITSVNSSDYEMEIVKNYPNPFSSSTTIQYDLEASSYVTLKVYDMVGNEIIQLYEGFQSSGLHSVQWNAKNKSGLDVGSGSYLYELSVQPASTAGTSPFKPFKIRKVMVIVK